MVCRLCKYRQTEIALVIIVENAGSGSKNAVPIAKDIFDAYYTK